MMAVELADKRISYLTLEWVYIFLNLPQNKSEHLLKYIRTLERVFTFLLNSCLVVNGLTSALGH